MNKTISKRSTEQGTGSYSYVNNFQIAQMNLSKLIQEERLIRKLNRSRERHD
jgi:hypothetical protein